MKRLFCFLAASAFIFASCSFRVSPVEQAKHKELKSSFNIPQDSKIETEEVSKDAIVEGSFIVKTKKGFDKTSFEKCGFEVKGDISFDGDNVKYWNIYKKGDAKKNLRLASSISGVISSSYNYKVELPAYTKDKAMLPEKEGIGTFGLDNGDYLKDPIADRSDYGLKITEALEAYRVFGYGDKNVVVGIIDTGINMAHKDFYDEKGKSIVLYAKSAATDKTLKQNVGDGKSFTEIPIGENWDRDEHGTHCSGTIAARGNNDVGIAGVAWKNTRLISYQGLGIEGGGSTWSIYGAMADLVKTVGILRKAKASRTPEEVDYLPSYLKNTDFQITQRTVPVNMSLGGSYGTEFAFYVLTNAVKADVLPVIAMGNEGRYTAAYPAAFPGVLAVGATTSRDKQKDFSNSGAWISVSAPGDGIMSCDVKGDNSYQSMSGTSMATPFVTGTIGYLLSFAAAHDLTPYQIKTLLEKTADKVDGMADFDERFGYGRVNVYNAVTAIDKGQIPSKNSVYSEAAVTVKVTNNGKTVYGTKITLIDEVTKAPLAYVTDLGKDASGIEKPVVFKGLIKDRQYSVYTFLGDEAKKETFTVSGSEQTVTIAFTKDLVWVSTVPNLHYNVGKDETDTKIIVFEAASNGTLPKDAKPILVYDYYYLDTTYFVAKPNTKYYVAITGFIDNAGVFRGGNYAIKIGDEPLNKDGEDVADGTRSASDNDTHEKDDTPVEAKAKGNAWNKTYGCNLVSPGKDSNGSDKPDIDFFYIEK